MRIAPKLTLCASVVAIGVFTSSALAQAGAKWDEDALISETKNLSASDFAKVRKAADAGDAVAQFKVALAYESGYGGLTKNINEAARWYTKAAQKNSPLAELYLGDFYMWQSGGPFAQNFAKSLEYYTRAAAHGSTFASVSIGDMYLFGRGVTRSYSKALDYYRRATRNAQTARDRLAFIEGCSGNQACIDLRTVILAAEYEFSGLLGPRDLKEKYSLHYRGLVSLFGAKCTAGGVSSVNTYQCELGSGLTLQAGDDLFEATSDKVAALLPKDWWRRVNDEGVDGWWRFRAGPPGKSSAISVDIRQQSGNHSLYIVEMFIKQPDDEGPEK